MSTGANQNNQHNNDQSGGGNNVGHPVPYAVYPVPNFQGKSGQADNQSTSRGSGGK